MAWCVVAYSMATVHFGFFYMGCELVFGGVWVCMLPAVAEAIENKQRHPMINYILLAITLLLLFTTHAFLLVIAGLILVFICLHRFSKFKLILITGMALLFIVKLLFLTDGYEAGKFGATTKDIFLPGTINKSYFTFFFKQQWNSTFVWVKYFWILLAAILIIKFKFKFLVTACIALLGLYLVIYSFMPNGESVAYMDSYQSIWYLAGWILFSYAVYFYFNQFSHVYIAGIFIVSMIGLYKISREKQYTDRIDYYTALMQQAGQKGCIKLYAEVSEVDMQKVMLNWATPYETLMLSTLKGRSQTIFINSDKSFSLEKYNSKDKFLGTTWLLDEPAKMNKRYFNLENVPYCRWPDVFKN